MEFEPDTTNVLYLDEYPELNKKIWLRRLAQQRLSAKAIEQVVIYLPYDLSDDPA